MDYTAYFALLEELGSDLLRLTNVEQSKTTAVRQDDLAVLNECMKQEQALSMALRGLEQRRAAAATALGLEGVTLSALAEHCPAEHRARAKPLSEEVLRRYQVYQSASEVARSTLECNLHQIEKYLSGTGGDSAVGTGYGGDTPDPTPPASMRTNIRA